MTTSRSALAALIADRLDRDRDVLKAAWDASGPVLHVVVDDLLPSGIAHEIAAAFPPRHVMGGYNSLKERKRIGVAMDAYPAILKEITFAFQDPRVLRATEAVTGIAPLNADANLYSSGLSSMGEGDFLNPHIDNSGNPLLGQYRRINTLYYVSPEWDPAWGGVLELWDGNRANPRDVEPRFNRLVLMNTNRRSYHSVRPVRGCGARTRNCVSNYYFSPVSPEGYDYSHVTSFRGRPEQPVRDLWLRLDAAARELYRKVRPRTPASVKHKYQGQDRPT
ncbi:MAG TPA: 2OG-Fe(II) oxygenase [Fibrobacteria bacterium]|nr:2OG-Fe(II) oxygenase [Fibrobacteria bacterium]